MEEKALRMAGETRGDLPAGPPDDGQLLALARETMQRSYSPYSRFRVGACVLCEDGRVYTGCNVENASYGLTICAERSTIFHAVAEEGPGMKIAELAVIALGQEFPPCGACRQVMAEFAAADTPIWFLRNGKPALMTMAELLPASFRI